MREAQNKIVGTDALQQTTKLTGTCGFCICTIEAQSDLANHEFGVSVINF